MPIFRKNRSIQFRSNFFIFFQVKVVIELVGAFSYGGGKWSDQKTQKMRNIYFLEKRTTITLLFYHTNSVERTPPRWHGDIVWQKCLALNFGRQTPKKNNFAKWPFKWFLIAKITSKMSSPSKVWSRVSALRFSVGHLLLSLSSDGPSVHPFCRPRT